LLSEIVGIRNIKMQGKAFPIFEGGTLVMADRVGQQLGNYHLVRLLGHGGTAQVYLGEHLRLETQAAIKILSSQLTGDEVNRLQAEARTIARLEHPHIVRILDFAVEDNIPFLVMSYAAHGTLRQRYPRGTRLPLPTILTYLKQAAEALQYAHDEHFIHRDIKPENMLLNRRDELLLSDFGIAVIAHSSHSLSTQEFMGTIAYMAPEQIQGKPRPASDQYALGVIIYEWLCGSYPFRGTLTEIALQHIHATPLPLHEALPTIPLELEAVVLKALAKDPHQRFANIREFATTFEQACQPLLLTSTSDSSQPAYQISLPAHPPEQASQPTTPTQLDSTFLTPQRALPRRMLVLGALATLGLSGATAGLTWFVTQSKSQTKPPAQPSVDNTLVVYTGHTSAVRAIAWSPNGGRIASGGDIADRTVQVWYANGGKLIVTFRGHTSNINTVAWSPDGTRIASAGGNALFGAEHVVYVWDATTGHMLLTYPGHTQPVHSLAWSPDGTRIASGGEDKTVQIWNPATGSRIATYTRHTATVNAVAWSHRGKLIASASADKTVQVWDVTTQALAFSLLHRNPVNTVAWSSKDGRLASASDNPFTNEEHSVQIWNATAATKPILTYRGHTTMVVALAWSPDNTRMVSASSNKFVPVWNTTTGATIYTYRRHTLGINGVGWSPEGKRVASASSDGTVRIWRVPSS
jgi:eukaryotic-like serine/threonine-protein kinase